MVDFTNSAPVPVQTPSVPQTGPDTAVPLPENTSSDVTDTAVPIGSPEAQHGLSDTADQTLSKSLTYGLPLLGAGMLDTLGRSIGVLDDNSMQNVISKFSTQAGDFYANNKQAFRLGGEIAGIALPGWAGLSVLKSARYMLETEKFGAALAKSPAIAKLLGSSAELTNLEKGVNDATAATVMDWGAITGRSIATPEVIAAKRDYTIARMVDSLRTTTAINLGYAGLYNQSEIFNPQEQSLYDYAKWTAAGYAIGGGVELAGARFALRKLVQNAVIATATEGVFGKTAIGTEEAAKLAQVISRPNARGPAISQYASTKLTLQSEVNARGSTVFQTNVSQDSTILDKQIMGQLDAAAEKDSHPFVPSISLSGSDKVRGQKQVLLSAASKDPMTFAFMTKIGAVPDDKAAFYKGINTALSKAAQDVESAQTLLGVQDGEEALEEGASEKAKARFLAAEASLTRISNAAEENHFVIEGNGDFSLFRDRAPRWLDNNSMASIARSTFIDKVPGPGTVRLYRGDTNGGLSDAMTAGSPSTGGWFTSNFSVAKKFGNVHHIDVTQQEMRDFAGSSYTSDAFVTNNPAYRNRMVRSSPEDLRKNNFDYSTISPKDFTNSAAKTITRTRLSLPNSNVFLNDDFSIGGKYSDEIGSAKTAAERSGLFAAGSKLIQNWRPVEGQTLTVTPDMPWFQHEAILELMSQKAEATQYVKFGPKGQLSDVTRTWETADPFQAISYPNTPNAYNSTKDAAFGLLDKKFRQFNKLMTLTEMVPVSEGVPAALRRGMLTPEQVIADLNLPGRFGSTPSPLIDLFAQLRLQGHDNLYDAFGGLEASGVIAKDHPLDLMQAAMKESAGVDFKDKAIPMGGNLFEQNDIRPTFIAAKSVPALPTADAQILAMNQTRRDLVMAALGAIDPAKAPLVTKMVQATAGGPMAQTARAVHQLFDGNLSGSGQVVYQNRINGQNPVTAALAMVADYGTKVAEQHVATLMEPTLEPLFGQITSRKNATSLLNLGRVNQAYRMGWDVAGIEYTTDGMARFKLAQSPINEQLKHLYFSDVPPDEITHLPDMSITSRKLGHMPIVVDKLAGDTLNEISRLSLLSGNEVNALRTTKGLNPVQLRSFHLPTPELSRDGTWFIRNPKGDVVASYMDGTPQGNQRQAMAAVDKLNKTDPHGETFVAQSMQDVKQQHSVFDDNFFQLTDYSDQALKTGASLAGGLLPAEIDAGPETLKNMIKSLNEQFMTTAARTRALIFEPEMDYVRQAAQTLQNTPMKTTNIFNRYAALMFGRAPVTNEGGFGKLYSGIETTLDNSLTWLRGHLGTLSDTPAVAEAGQQLKSTLRMQTADKEYEQYQKSMGRWSPFLSTQDYLDSTYKSVTPKTVRNYLGQLSKASSTMAIRAMDLGMGFLNISSVITNAPAVMQAMLKKPGEAAEDYMLRTGAFGSIYAGSNRTFSPMKTLTNTVKDYFNGAFNGPMQDAAENGMFQPEYAAIARVLSQPTSGDPSKLQKFIKASSWVADNSEVFSRKMAWAMGYKIAKELHGFEGKDAYIYANHIVDDVIGNYAALNKPAMFQGAIGMPLGAFQTYMFNFYRRMYGYIESGNVRALATQYATQASLYGAQSVPGWNAFNQMMFSSRSGDDTTQSRIKDGLPDVASELLLHGTLSGIPKIFGLNAPALYTRGSVDMTQLPPSLAEIQRAPPMQFVAETATGIYKTLQNFIGAGGFSAQQQMEILANFSTNHALKNIMNFAADGITAPNGNLVETGTRDMAHMAAAMLSAVPTNTRQLQDAYYTQTQVEKNQESLRQILEEKTRSSVRAGTLTVDALQDMAHNYLQSGGNPAYFGEWLRNAAVAATSPEADRKLKALMGKQDMVEFTNMLAAIQRQ